MGMFTEWRDDENAKLQQQLQEALAENAALVAEFQRLADEPPTLEEIAADLDKIEMLGKELAEAQELIKKLRRCANCKHRVEYGRCGEVATACALDVNEEDCQTCKNFDKWEAE